MALLVMMLGLFNGIRTTVLESATTLSSGHVNVAGFYKVTAGQSSPLVTHSAEVLKVIEANVPEIDYVTSRSRGWAKVISDTGDSLQSGIGGLDIDNEPGFRRVIHLKEGTFEGLREPNTILIFEQQAEKLGVRVGDALTISAQTTRGVNNTADVRVVAIGKNVGLLSSFNMFVPAKTVRDLYQFRADASGVIQLYLKDMRDIPKVEERLRKVLVSAGYVMMDKDPRAFWQKFDTVNREAWTGQKLDVTNWEDEVSFINWTVTAIQWLGNALIFVLLVVIAVGIMNTLWIAIRERTREIGTLRSLGMQRGRVLTMFLTEAFLLSLGSAIAGVLLGVVLCAIINAGHIHLPTSVQLFLLNETLHLTVSLGSVLRGLALIVGCTTAVSLIPSFLAARLKPVTAMSQVG